MTAEILKQGLSWLLILVVGLAPMLMYWIAIVTVTRIDSRTRARKVKRLPSKCGIRRKSPRIHGDVEHQKAQDNPAEMQA